MSVPKTMKAWILEKPIPREELGTVDAFARCCKLETAVPVPAPAPGQVLVQVCRGTINPNDLLHISGEYALSKDISFPRPIGFEGAGRIVSENQVPFYLPKSPGTRVAFYADRGGLFGEYVAIDAKNVIPLPNEVEFETAACSVTNPVTTVRMIDEIKSEGHSVFINTAAASALGKLLIRYANSVGLQAICVVRRDEQAVICRQEGATHVLNSTEADFEEKLAAIVKETGCRFAYDCIGGSMPDLLLKALPPNAVVGVYGNLSGQPVKVGDSLVPGKSIRSFTAANSLEKLWMLQLILVIRKVTNGMGDIFRSEVQRSFPLEELPEAYAHYVKNMTNGKVQIAVNDSL